MNRKSLITFATLLTFSFLLSLKNTNLAKAVSSTIVINEVQIAGESAKDEFIELHNLTDQDINLGDYRIVRRTETGTNDSSVKAFGNSDVIPANGFFLWTGNEWTGEVTPDSSTSGVLASNNGIALKLELEGDAEEVIDSVAWGTASNIYVEGSVFPTNPPAGQSIQRVGADTDDNSVDFVLRESPDPQNSQSNPTATPSVTPTLSPSPTASPSPSVSPTATPSPSPSVEPSPSPEPTPTQTATPTPDPTSTPEPTSTPRVRSGRLLARFFSTRNRVRECSLEYHTVHIGFHTFRFPRITCEWVSL